MKRIKTYSVFMLGIIIGFASGIMLARTVTSLLPRFTFEREAYYATHSQAAEHGAVARGWLPEFVPDTATNICDIHCLDINSALLRFSLSEDGRQRLRDAMQSVAASECDPPDSHLAGLVDWWPEDVLRAPDCETYSTTHDGSPCFAAISSKSDIIYMWF